MLLDDRVRPSEKLRILKRIGLFLSLALAVWLLLGFLGILLRPFVFGPGLLPSQTYSLVPNSEAPPQDMEEARRSIRRLFPEYREAPDGWKITVGEHPGMPDAGASDKEPNGNCVIWLDHTHPEFSSATTPAHEFNHCRRHDPWINRSIAGVLYHWYVEVFPMPMELWWRRLTSDGR